MSTMAMLRRRELLALPVAMAAVPAQATQGRPASATRTPELAAQTLGTYLGPGCNGTVRLNALSAWLGRRPTRHSDFLAQNSWTEMLKAADRGGRCWQATGLAMSIGVPMLPLDRSSTLARGARGEHDAHFAAIARTFVRLGLGDAVIRLGWEFNQGWYAWRAERDPAAWVTFWQRIVTAMRAEPGANFRFDWCTAWSRGIRKVSPEAVYPGDAYVDIIGMDIYNVSWNPMTPQRRWRMKTDADFGLGWQRAFAAEHGKPVSFPEWGTGKRPDGRGGGDDAYFIERMAEWLAGSNLAYHNYWDYKAPDFNARLSDGSKPAAAAAFLAAFGGER
jgi:hypothetical protein